MASKTLVIVESPAKAKKIAGYLGPDYEVLASVGHVRDLVAKKSDLPLEERKKPWAKLAVDVDDGYKAFYIVHESKKALQALSPAATLERGYAIVQSVKGAIIRDQAQVAVDQEVQIRVSVGEFSATRNDNKE